LQFIDVAEDKWLEHSLMLDNLFKYCQEIEPKLWIYFLVFKNEDIIRKLVAIVGVDFYLLISDRQSSLQILTVNQQRSLLEQTPPKFIVETNMLILMLRQVQQIMEIVMKPRQQQQGPEQPGQQQQIPSGPLGQAGQQGQAQLPQLQQLPGEPQVPSGSSPQIQAQQQHQLPPTTAPGGVDVPLDLHRSFAGLSL
jgi:hypothetical protein